MKKKGNVMRDQRRQRTVFHRGVGTKTNGFFRDDCAKDRSREKVAEGTRISFFSGEKVPGKGDWTLCAPSEKPSRSEKRKE